MEEQNQGGMKQWLQDNLRIILSIAIVFVIGFGIYSYSKQAPVTDENQNQASEETAVSEDSTSVTGQEQASETKTDKEAPVASQETEQSFIETAIKGDGSTTLARRALANYLEKNPDTALTPEHKIYIEDFLRKNATKNKVSIGTSIEFSKSSIQDAIGRAKNLNEKQLQNLHKYAVRVPSLK
jgi:hypothetical protein